MEGWTLFWKIVLISTAAVFALVSVAVAVGGFRDVKELLRSIKEQHDESDEESQ
ncbi:MAG: hypothetical protein MI807_11055 [Verrucomicrobiales bacterium]|nr:hypothetical protein [Verrucomicrobiales bacterium]